MDKARVIQVIETTLTRRGNGRDNPIRIITQYWSLDGKLLAEVDPNNEAVAAEQEFRCTWTDSCGHRCVHISGHQGVHHPSVPWVTV